MSLPLTPVLLSALTGRKGNSRIFHFSLHFNGGIFLGYLMHELTETETIPGYLPTHTRARARGEKRRHFLTHTHWRRAAALPPPPLGPGTGGGQRAAHTSRVSAAWASRAAAAPRHHGPTAPQPHASCGAAWPRMSPHALTRALTHPDVPSHTHTCPHT